MSFSIGVILFLVEFSFVFVFQGFLQAIGLVDAAKITVAAWYPKSLIASILLFLLFGLGRSLVYMAKTYVNNATSQAFVRLQRVRIMEYGMKNVDSISSHQLISTFTERVGQSGTVLQSISQIVLMGTACLLFFLMGLRMAPVEMLVGVATLGILMVPFIRFNHRITATGNNIQVLWERVNKILLQGLKHNFFLNIYGLVDREVSNATSYLVEMENEYRRIYRIISLKSYLPNLIGMFVICLITYVGVQYVHTPGMTLISFFYLFLRFAQGATDVNTALSDFRVGLSSFKEVHRFHELLELQQGDKLRLAVTKSVPSSFFRDGIEIKFNHVTFSYVSGKPIVNDVSIECSKGQVLLIKGQSGVGKSTLLLLALGLRNPDQGQVLVNGQSISEVRQNLFEKIAYVGPEPYMIEGTIRENLLFGHPVPEAVSDVEMDFSIETAQLLDAGLKLDFFVNEQTPLSTGQKQRVSIARAILRKPLLLILDEATANLDGITEKNFIESIRPILKGITTLVISHKSSFDAVATQTLVMKKA